MDLTRSVAFCFGGKMGERRQLYCYEGAVLKYSTLIHEHWKAYVYAVSKAQARSLLAWRYKTDYGYMPSVYITLPGTLTIVEKEN